MSESSSVSQKSFFQKLHAAVNLPIAKYYLKYPIDGLRFFAIIFWQHRIKRWFNLDPNFNPVISDSTKIDIVMPSIDKDYETLEYVLPSIRKYIRHPIGEIIVICPPSERIEALCKKNKCRFVDENTVLPITIKDIDYWVGETNRSGWIYQQLLKWGADSLCKNEYFLITESDTVFVRPQVFRHNNKTIMPCSSDLCHLPYYKAYEKLLGEGIDPVINFTSHHSLFNKKVLSDLKKRIEEKHSKVWYKAILSILDPNEGACVSDYETYGQFAFRHYRKHVCLEYWSNLSLPTNRIKQIANLTRTYEEKFKAISFHSYNS